MVPTAYCLFTSEAFMALIVLSKTDARKLRPTGAMDAPDKYGAKLFPDRGAAEMARALL